ncbi:MAG: transglutaminase-like domain-containing protein [candidate division Zixibacteria bacterium]|nr:transglutaminase-like domain-containing protein [candidate division Zixibacteria bacterium]
MTITLESAGDNRAALESVLTHYASADDTLKLQAAYFLIGNMEGHCYATYALQDTAGAEIDFDVLDYPDYNAMKAACDTLETRHGELDFERKEKIYDLDVITSAFLINQIDYAFRAWREKPWAKDMSFDNFCRYVLPYRGSSEPLEPWRENFWDKYQHLSEEMTDPSDPIEAACLINDDIKSWFTFDPRFYYHPTDQSLSEMRENGLGRCEDMTNVTIFAMRTNGLAVTSDYTPHWANAGNNHAWNAIVSPDGSVTPFMGAERNPGRYHLPNKIAKAYRKMFNKQMDNLVFQEKKQEKLPGWLSGRSYKDVTTEYTDVRDVTVVFKKKIPDSVDIAYLCVFNSGEWKAIHWGRIDGDSSLFTDMGTEIAYLPALYMNEEIVSFGAPFILGADGLTHELRYTADDGASVQLTSTTRRKQEVSTDGIAKTFLTVGQEYELQYWDDGWHSLGRAVADDKPLEFKGVPTNCLYWLVAVDSDREERIFTFDGDRQVWW